jgi:CubicO group peptidase (beta-lactamase class C family)
MKIFGIFVCVGLFVLSAVSVAFAQNNQMKLPETVSGQRVAAYLAAFNSGDEGKMRAFFTENVSEENLKRRPIEARLEVYREMRGEMQSLTARRVIESKPEKVSVLVQNQRGNWLRFDFMFEPQPPHKLLGIGVDEAHDPAIVDNLPAALTRAQFNSALEEHLDKLSADGEFSGVVLVAKKDRPIFQKAVGLANQELKIPNRLDTKFNLGSINKLFTQIAVAQLVAAGKLSYDDKIGKILPDYPNKDAAEKVAVRHLLTMTSGIGDIFGAKYDAAPKEKLRSNKDFLPLFASDPLRFEPGAKREYSNGSYVVLGLIIEKLSGQSYYDYVRQNIFQPAGMTNTDSFEKDGKTANIAEGYTRRGVDSADKKMRKNNYSTRPARGSAAGGGYSTVEDMLKFSLALQSGKLKQYDLSSPNGQAAKPLSGGFAGGSLGINAIFEMDVEGGGYTIVVMSNYDPPSANQVGKFVRGLLSRLSE